MMLRSPEIGFWYRSPNTHASFEIVALDEHQGTIEIQYIDGDLDELDWHDWQKGHFIATPPPDDALNALGMDQQDNWDDELQIDDPLFDESDRYDWSDNTDFEDI